MASKGIGSILEAAVETKAYWSSGNRERDQGFNPEDCRSESTLGKSKVYGELLKLGNPISKRTIARQRFLIQAGCFRNLIDHQQIQRGFARNHLESHFLEGVR
jgi:hypothetical protein